MDRKTMNEEIIKCYTTEDITALAKRLGITVVNLRKKASRLGVKKSTISNQIIDNKKRCACCGQWLDISNFNRDKYQPNGVDYYCKSCRKTKPQPVKKTVDKSVTKTVNKNKSTSVRLNVNHKRLQTIIVDGVESRICKKCTNTKPLTDFYEGKGVCKACILQAKRERLKAQKRG